MNELESAASWLARGSPAIGGCWKASGPQSGLAGFMHHCHKIVMAPCVEVDGALYKSKENSTVQLTSESILEFLSNELGVDTDGLAPDTMLFSTGTIDSFGLVTLMTFLEGECSIRIKPTDVNLDNFDSIGRIMDYVRRSTA